MRKKISYRKLTRDFLLLEETEETEEAESGEEEAEDSEDTEKEEKPEEPAQKPSSVLDAEIEAVLIDFEKRALGERKQNTFLCKKGLSVLLEDASLDLEIDIDMFASDVARLVKNYDSLLDIEALLIDKSKDYIESKYGEEAMNLLVDKLAETHGLSADDEGTVDQEPAPLAVGAFGGDS